jgi:membrane-associated phospholipid phosphatase
MLRGLAYVVSLIFHPLLIVTYITVLLLLINPYAFGVPSIADRGEMLLAVFFSSFFIPALAVVLLRLVGFIDSLELKDKQDRIGPYVITSIFYLWLFINLKNGENIPPIFVSFLLGTVIGLFLAFFINIFSKISAHAVGMGGLIAMVVITMVLFNYGPMQVRAPWLGLLEVELTTILMISILATGMVGTSRLILKAHTLQDLYGGFLIGFMAQFIALRFILM